MVVVVSKDKVSVALRQSSSRVVGEKWLDLKCILKENPMGFINGLGIRCKRKVTPDFGFKP
jgi:hypothetical protein